jgi:hypothetical protein
MHDLTALERRRCPGPIVGLEHPQFSFGDFARRRLFWKSDHRHLLLSVFWAKFRFQLLYSPFKGPDLLLEELPINAALGGEGSQMSTPV